MSENAFPDPEIQELLRSLPKDLVFSLKDARVMPLAGLTNRVFRLDGSGVGVVIRLPRAETQSLIDRDVEACNAKIAERIGIGAPVLFADTAKGIMVTQIVPGVHPLAFGAISRDAAVRAGEAFARLHRCGEVFWGTFSPMQQVGVLSKEIRAEAASALIPQLEAVSRELGMYDVAPVPSHCDPVAENILDDGETIRMIDWEYSAMADPAWDLAYFSLEGGLGAAIEGALVDGYAMGGERAMIARRIQLMKPFCDAVSALWALKQAQVGNKATDFAAYGEMRLARSLRALSDLAL